MRACRRFNVAVVRPLKTYLRGVKYRTWLLLLVALLLLFFTVHLEVITMQYLRDLKESFMRSIQSRNGVRNAQYITHVEIKRKDNPMKNNGGGELTTTNSDVVYGTRNSKDGGRIAHSNRQFIRKPKEQREPINCELLKHPFFPLCLEKASYMRWFWNRDRCYYEHHKMNGTRCSVYEYLTKVEPFCMGRREIYQNTLSGREAVMNLDLESLLGLFKGEAYKWMKGRISYLWPSWVSGGLSFARRKKVYKRKRVIAFLGSMSVNPWVFDWAGKGGPLGELIQWADLITALHLLGHNVTVAKKPSELEIIMNHKTECAVGRNTGGPEEGLYVDEIYTDINGVLLMKSRLAENNFAKYRCALRVLDSFGTYVEYNFPHYPHKIPMGRSDWANLNLIPTQFLTLYPHTHDNRFLGFVIPDTKQRKLNASPNNVRVKVKRKALLYAKLASYTKKYLRYLQIASEYFEIHATSANDDVMPSYVHNHGPVSSEKVQELLSESDLFIGVGFPYEGPGPLEAMANGVPFLQPKFDTPINKLNDEFWAGKPTLRKLTSQCPYMEEFVGEPYCYTINVTDELLLRRTLERIKSMKPLPGKIPKEFTTEGFIERTHVYTEYTEYCNPYTPRWPPVNHLQIYLGESGQSCKEVCMSRGLVCERTFFHDIDTHAHIEKYSGSSCQEKLSEVVLHAPSMISSTRACYTQAHAQVYSCMYGENDVIRLCPCRDYEKEQSAVCKNCL